jgi:hypothetical protein
VFGASGSELGLVALLVAIVLLAPLAPRIGDAIGALFERPKPGPAPARHEPQGQGPA